MAKQARAADTGLSILIMAERRTIESSDGICARTVAERLLLARTASMSMLGVGVMFPKGNRRKGPKSELKRLVATADRWFSEYIRRRDANAAGICLCVTCGRPMRWNDGDVCHCGHFVPRGKMVVRYDEANCHGQCRFCNCNDANPGRQYEHGQAIDRIHGAGTADRLVNLSKVAYFKYDRLWLADKIAEYKEKVKQLRKEMEA